MALKKSILDLKHDDIVERYKALRSMYKSESNNKIYGTIADEFNMTTNGVRMVVLHRRAERPRIVNEY